MTKIVLNIERHYGNKEFKMILGNMLSMRLSNLKFSGETYERSYYNMENNKKAFIQGEKISE